jgi:hypothetical protein
MESIGLAPGMELCIACGPKPRSHFGVDSRCANGLKRRCKLCESEYQKQHRKKNKKAYASRSKRWRETHAEQRTATARAYREKMRTEAFQAYSPGEIKCSCHGCDSKEPKFLGIDHINGGGRKHREEIRKSKRGGGLGIYSWLRQQGYPPGYRVLCHNCNMAVGLYGKCPHEHGLMVRSKTT